MVLTLQGVVGDGAGHYCLLIHVLEYLQGALRLLALLARAYPGVTSYDVGRYVLLLHFLEYL